MKGIAELDVNYATHFDNSRSDLQLYDVCQPPFRVYGLIKPENDEDCFHRLPHSLAQEIRSNVTRLQRNSAGGRVTFRTNSNYIGIYAEYEDVGRFSHMPLIATAGFDVYTREKGQHKHVKALFPPIDVEQTKIFKASMEIGDYLSYCPKELYGASITKWKTEIGKDVMRDYLIYFPIYSTVKKMYIILEEEATVLEAGSYCHDDLPIIFYGNSVTQGGCASRPGNVCASLVSQRYDCNFVNLGFSGSAKGEKCMAEYLCSLESRALILDYDHNAPAMDFLERSYLEILEIIRDKRPDLPVFCVSRPVVYENHNSVQCREVIQKIVEEYRRRGDRKLFFINGGGIADNTIYREMLTIEGVHLTDVGMARFADVIGESLEQIM